MLNRGVVLGVLVLSLSQAAAGSAAAEGVCPNDGLRSELRSGQLPDCRAYELVTPPYKEGVLVFPIAIPRSEDGSHLIGSSLGAFAGDENVELGTGGSLGAHYEFSRTGAGWTTTALDPPASQFPFDNFIAANVDLGESLWTLRPPGESHQNEGSSQKEGSKHDEGLYVRRPDRSFALVGPAVPPSAPLPGEREEVRVRGASNELAHVLISREAGFLWPGDTTSNGESLYQYNGTGNPSPELVGVQGGQGSTALISECGTNLGSAGSEDTYNAMSTSGAAVFFTAIHSEGCPGTQPPVNELFARINHFETVAISEPTLADCPECSTATPENAHFEGASSDGSKVFFTTTQPLRGNDMSKNLYEYDFFARPGQKIGRVSSGAPTMAGVQGVTRISEDGSHVYFVASGVLTAEANGSGQVASEGGDNLYVYEPDPASPGQFKTVFVATLSEADSPDWAEFDFRPAQSTPDGRFLLFSSAAHLTLDDTSAAGLSQLFQYDAQTGKILRVSIGQEDFNHGGNIANAGDIPEIPSPLYAEKSFPAVAESAMAMSNNGAYVFFTSSDSLTPQATSGDRNATGEGHPSVYEYHAGNLYLISDGQDTATISVEPAVSLLGTNATGTDVFFTQVNALVPQDTDTQQDLYDAHIGGGFAPPTSPSGCLASACQGPLGGPPSLASPGSIISQTGSGNLTPPAPTSVRAKALTRAQKLAQALRACRKRPTRKRRVCEKHAKNRYGHTSNAQRKGR
jgi:hypothetical protein